MDTQERARRNSHGPDDEPTFRDRYPGGRKQQAEEQRAQAETEIQDKYTERLRQVREQMEDLDDHKSPEYTRLAIEREDLLSQRLIDSGEWVSTYERVQALARQEASQFAKAHLASKGWAPPDCVDSGGLALHRPDWLITDYIETGTVGLLIGAFGTAKTFLALDWSCCIATGRRWHGHKTKICNVLYIVAEGAQGIGNRKTAWEVTNTVIEKDALVFITGTVPLDNPAAVAWLKEQIEHYEIDFLGIDTIARNKGGTGENDEQDVGRLIEVMYECRDVRGKNMTTVFGVHHKGKDGSRGARGSSRWGSDVDFVHEVEEKDGIFTLRTTKTKESGKAPDWHFTLAEVEVEPARGELEAITSCVIEPCDEPAPWLARDEYVEYVHGHPGAANADIARALNKTPSAVLRGLKRRQRQGVLIQHDDKGWYPAK